MNNTPGRRDALDRSEARSGGGHTPLCNTGGDSINTVIACNPSRHAVCGEFRVCAMQRIVCALHNIVCAVDKGILHEKFEQFDHSNIARTQAAIRRGLRVLRSQAIGLPARRHEKSGQKLPATKAPRYWLCA